MDIGDVPILGSVANLFGGIADKIERGVNSSEHNFKRDLMKALIKGGMDEQTAVQVQSVMDTGDDEGLGKRLRALIAMNVIPASAIPVINQLAEQDGVPTSSIDQAKMYEPMSLQEVGIEIDADHMRMLGRGDLVDQIERQKTLAAQQQAGASNYGFGMSY